MTFIHEYLGGIRSGEILVGRRVRAIYERLVDDIDNPKDGIVFDEKRANKPIEFMERFVRHSKGPKGGQLIQLELWQKALIQAIFGFIHEDTGLRKYREVMLYVGRKNGKTMLAAGIALYMLIADGESGAEVYSYATKREQSKILFDGAYDAVRQSADLSKVLKKRRNDLYFPTTFSKMMPLSREASTLDGLNSSCVIIDELHAHPSRSGYDVLKTSMSARSQPLMLVITTAGSMRGGAFDDIHDYANRVVDGDAKDGTFLPVLYELDKPDEWKDPAMWCKANPGLGTIKTMADLLAKLERASQSPRDRVEFMCKDMNIISNTSSAWLSYDDINNEERFDIEQFRGGWFIGGADLSRSVDLTCATAMMLGKDDRLYVKMMAWIPEDLLLKHEVTDKVPYRAWVDEGYVRTCPGGVIDYSMVTSWFKELVQNHDISPLEIGYDAWSAAYWANEMKDTGFRMRPVRQGALTLSDPLQRMAVDLQNKRIVYDDNPVMRWCLANVGLKEDRNGNMLPQKGNGATKRIDGMMAMLDAYVVMLEHYNELKEL